MVNPLVEIPLYAVMAVLIGLLAVAHIRFFYFVRDWFRDLSLSEYANLLSAPFWWAVSV